MKNKEINSILVFIKNQTERLEREVDKFPFNDADESFEKDSENQQEILDELANILTSLEEIDDIFSRDEEIPAMQESCETAVWKIHF